MPAASANCAWVKSARLRSLREAEVREALRAELGRFVSSSWRRAQLGNKTDVISQLAREMDLSPKLARQYAEIALQQQGDERGEEKSPGDKQAGQPPLFRLSNHHTDDCGRPPAVDGGRTRQRSQTVT